METLATSTSDLLFSGGHYRGGGSSPFNFHSNLQFHLLRFPKHVALHFSHSISLNRNCLLLPPISASSEPLKHLEDDEDQIEGIMRSLWFDEDQIEDQSKTVRVKFKLQKECSFGEQFYVVGNDPMLGLWEPSDAIPMDWSDGNIWTAELYLPIGKSIHFKFILKGNSGSILWQLGPDRIIQIWETVNTIIVSEDWDDAALQEVVEEEVSFIQTEPVTALEMLDVVETPMAIIADNITCHEGKSPDITDRTTTTGASTCGSNGSARSVKNIVSTNDEVVVSFEVAPVLVPGLTPLQMVDSEEASLVQVEDRGIAADSFGPAKTKEHNVEEGTVNDSFRQKDAAETMKINDEKSGYEHEEKPQLASRAQEPFNLTENRVLDNDIQWGLKTLQKLFKGWGFRLHQSDRRL